MFLTTDEALRKMQKFGFQMLGTVPWRNGDTVRVVAMSHERFEEVRRFRGSPQEGTLALSDVRGWEGGEDALGAAVSRTS